MRIYISIVILCCSLTSPPLEHLASLTSLASVASLFILVHFSQQQHLVTQSESEALLAKEI